MELPADLSPDDFDKRYRLDVGAWIPAIHDVCAAHDISATRLTTYPDGSNLLARVTDNRIVKIFPPFHRDQWLSEHLALSHIAGHSPIAVPDLVAAAERPDGWSYVIMSLVPGDTLETHWPNLTHIDRARLLENIGDAMARIHKLPTASISSLPPRWESFIAEQAAKCRAHHLRLGMPNWFVQKIDDWVRGQVPLLTTTSPVLLTGEYTPFNILVSHTAGRWSLTGMIDFGDAMVGHPDYDLLGPCAFLAGGDKQLVRALFRGYGHTGDYESLRRRLMALLALHRYSNITRQLRIADWQTKAQSIDSLMRIIWPD